MIEDTLRRPTLVLNRNWQPIRVVTVERALILLFRGAANVIDPGNYRIFSWDEWAVRPPRPDQPSIRGVRVLIRVPEVITLSRYYGRGRTSVAFSRRNLFKRDHYRCQYCGVRPATKDQTIDHIVPRARGGASSWENCVLACRHCNIRKADRTPPQAGMALRSKPRKPVWTALEISSSPRIESWAKFVS